MTGDTVFCEDEGHDWQWCGCSAGCGLDICANCGLEDDDEG